MRILIDETGSFSGVGSPPAISLVGALIVPDSRMGSLERTYAKLRPTLPQDNGEVKGRLMTESQVAKVVSLLFEHSAIFEATCIDLGTHSKQTLEDYQRKQAHGITAELTEEHPQWLKDQAWQWRRDYKELSLPLVVQTEINFRLVKRIIEHGTMYFSQRRPEELGAFNWVIDAKGTSQEPTKWESWWSKFVMPALQNRALRDPFKSVTFGDYTYMERFQGKLSPFWQQKIKNDRNKPAMNLGRILGESIRFSKDAEPGLELVDIVTNATRRALLGNLQESGWKSIPGLMIHTSEPHYVEIISFQNEKGSGTDRPYAKALKRFSKTGRTMISAKFNQ
jgi:hypothetical protein